MNSRNKLGSTGESQEGSTDDENEEIFEVERVIDIKYENDDNGRKNTKYRVRWKGFGPIDDTWEPLENFTDLCLPVVQGFRQKYKKMKAKVAQSSSDFDVNILSEEIGQIINKTEPSLKQPEIYYLVRWKGYDQSGNTWEHEEELRHAQNMIDDFNRRRKQGLARKIKKCNKEAYTNEIEHLDHYRKIKSEIDDEKGEHRISKTRSSNKVVHEKKKKEKIKAEKLEHKEKETGKHDNNVEVKIGKLSSQINRDKTNERENEKERHKKSEEIRIKARRQHNRESEFRDGKEKKIQLEEGDEVIHEEKKKGKFKTEKLEHGKKETGKTDSNLEVKIGKLLSQINRDKRNEKENEKETHKKSEEIIIKARRQHNRKSEIRDGNEKKIPLQMGDEEKSEKKVKESKLEEATEIETNEDTLNIVDDYLSSLPEYSHRQENGTEVKMKQEKSEKKEKESELEEATEIETKEDTLNIVDDYLSCLPDYNPEKVKVEIDRQSSVTYQYSKDLLLSAIREDDYQKVFSYLRNNQINNQDLDYSQLFLEVARCGQRDMALLLATRVPDLSIEDEFGDTALCMAASKGDAAFAHYLLVMGVPIQEAQVRPKDLAEKAGHSHFNVFLNQYAKENSTET